MVIAEQDKDLLSLLSDRVSLLHIQNGVLVRPDTVRSKFGVGPEQMRDDLALVGDTADNIKGVPKIGPEHAKRLLGEFGSVSGLLKALDEKHDDGSWKVRPDGIRDSPVANVGLLDHALKLVTLRTDAPILEALEQFELFAASRIRPVSSGGTRISDSKAQQACDDRGARTRWHARVRRWPARQASPRRRRRATRAPVRRPPPQRGRGGRSQTSARSATAPTLTPSDAALVARAPSSVPTPRQEVRGTGRAVPA